MKKYLMLPVLALLLVACGNDEQEEAQVPQTQEQPAAEEGVFEHEMNEYKTLATYTADGEDEITMDYDGYRYTFKVSAIQDVNTEEEYIALIGETENTREEEVQFNSDILIVTDQKEQTSNEDGVGRSEPTVILDSFVLAPIEKGIPETFTMKLDPPFKNVDGDFYEADEEPTEFTFTKQ